MKLLYLKSFHRLKPESKKSFYLINKKIKKKIETKKLSSRIEVTDWKAHSIKECPDFVAWKHKHIFEFKMALV